MFLMNFGTAELLLIAGALVLLFGSTQLPKLARALGESKRALKEGFLDNDGGQLKNKDS